MDSSMDPDSVATGELYHTTDSYRYPLRSYTPIDCYAYAYPTDTHSYANANAYPHTVSHLHS